MVSGHELQTRRCHTSTVLGVAFGSDGKRLATSLGDKALDVQMPKSASLT